MDDIFGEWVESMGLVESMGVANGRGWQEVGVASGWNLWVWLKCIGVVSGRPTAFIMRSIQFVMRPTASSL